MSNFYYKGTYSRSAAVTGGVALTLASPNERILCVSRGSLIEVLKLQTDQLELTEEIELFSYIHTLCCLRIPQAPDSLLALTHSHHLFQIFFSTPIKKLQINIKSLSVKRECNNSLIKLNSTSTLLCAYHYANEFQIFKTRFGKIYEKDSFIINNDGYKVVDLDFIESSDILVALSAGEGGRDSFVNFYEISSNDNSSRLLGCHKFIRRPGKILQFAAGQLVVLMDNSYQIFNFHLPEADLEENSFGNIIGTCEVDRTRWLLSNNIGKVYLFMFSPSMEFRSIGFSSASSVIVHLDNGIFFFGSKVTNSKIVNILREAQENNSVQELQSFKSFCPINDFKILDDNNLDLLSLQASVGEGLGSGFLNIYKSIPTSFVSEIEMANVNGLWSLKINSHLDTHIILSILNTTKVLIYSQESIKTITPGGLITNEATLFICICTGGIVQVTQSGIYFLSLDWTLLKKYTISDIGVTKISMAYFTDSTLCVVTEDNIMNCYNVTQSGIEKRWDIQRKNEIGCVNIFENLVAIGYWVENTVVVIDKNNGKEFFNVILSENASAKSIRFVRMCGGIYLMAGLRDGVLVYFELETRKIMKLTIGCQDVVLQEFQYKNQQIIIAACTKSVMLYEFQNTVVYSLLDCNKINYMASFNTEGFTDCIVAMLERTFTIFSLDEMQKFSVTFEPKEKSVIKFEYFNGYIVSISKDLSLKYYLVLYSKTFQELSSRKFYDCEEITCLSIIKDLIYTGTEFPGNGYHIKTFYIEDSNLIPMKIFTHDERIFFIKPLLNNFIFTKKHEIVYCEAVSNSIQCISSLKIKGPIIALDILNEYISVVSNNLYLSVYAANKENILLLYSYNLLDHSIGVKMLTNTHIAVTDHYFNIIVFEIQGPKICPVSGFNLEYQLVSSISSFKVNQEIYGGERLGAVLSTTSGAVHVIVGISLEEHHLLQKLQEAITKCLQSCENFIEKIHKPKRRLGYVKGIEEMVNGDIIEKFESLSAEDKRTVLGRVSSAIGSDVTEKNIMSLYYSLSRIH